MPPHKESHFAGSQTVRDIVIGMSDGLTVPFALAAGISGAISATHIVVTAGFAEIAAGSIAMGLGGYLAARSDAEHYYSEREREEREIIEKPQAEEQEVREILEQYGLTSDESAQVVTGLKRRPEAYRDFMMRFELGLEEPDPNRAVASAGTIAGSYVFGGIIPLAPYLALHDARVALWWSVGVTLFALGVFGGIKGHFTGVKPMKSGLQTILIGGLAAAVAFFVAKAVA